MFRQIKKITVTKMNTPTATILLPLTPPWEGQGEASITQSKIHIGMTYK